MNERRAILILILAILSVGLTSISAAIYYVAKVQNQLVQAGDFHMPALQGILAIDESVEEVVQENLSYILFDQIANKNEYQKKLNQLNEKIAAFPAIARLYEPSEESELELFQEIENGLVQLKNAGDLLIENTHITDAVSDDVFFQYEKTIDTLHARIKQLVEIEKAEVASAQLEIVEIVTQAEKDIIILGILTLLVAITVAVWARHHLTTMFALRDAAEREARIIGTAVESAAVGIVFSDARDPELPLAYANSQFQQITGYASSEVVGLNCRFLQGPDTDQEHVDKIRTALAANEPVNLVLRNYRKNGEAFWNDLTISPVRDKHDSVSHYVGVLNDITDRLNLEQQLLQSQKMDAVGQLAGGIAHDFNNYLTVISGAAHLIATGDGKDIDHWTQQILDAGERTSSLTNQLLAFARKQVLVPQNLAINDALKNLSPFLRQTIGENITLEIVPDSDAGKILMDPMQLEQVIVNLVINARDALPDGGAITLESGNVILSEENAASHTGVKSGPYTLLAISDNGTGIDPAVKDRIFEPFVTTKKPGEGTGLGLSTVYGILEQSGATIQVYSEVGHGTTFKIYFPSVGLERESISRESKVATIKGEGLVLLVEDDPMVRNVTAAMLRKLDFSVVQAKDGLEGLEVLRKRDDVRLLLTDITMPNMGGIKLAENARKLHPDLVVLFMSGYTQNGIVHHGLVDPDHVLMQKPFTIAELIRKLREALKLTD